MLVTLWVFSNHATQWERCRPGAEPRTTNGTKIDMWVRCTKTVASASNQQMAGNCLTASRKQSISQNQLKDCPLTKQDILHVYSDVFTGIGKFPGPPYKFQLKDNAKPARHAPRKVPIHLQDAFHREIRNLEKLGILEETKDVTEWVNSFVIVEKKTPDVSNSQPDRKL